MYANIIFNCFLVTGLKKINKWFIRNVRKILFKESRTLSGYFWLYPKSSSRALGKGVVIQKKFKRVDCDVADAPRNDDGVWD